MSNKRPIITIVILLAVVNVTLGIRWYVASRATPATASCVNNLRQIASAKEQWKLEHNKTTNDIPMWEDLRSYLGKQLVCPEGGTYTLGKISEAPTCSISGARHSSVEATK